MLDLQEMKNIMDRNENDKRVEVERMRADEIEKNARHERALQREEVIAFFIGMMCNMS